MGTKPDTAQIKNMMLQAKINKLQRQVLEEHGFDTRPQHLEDSVQCEPDARIDNDCVGCGFYIDSDENLNWDHIQIATVERYWLHFSGVWGVDYVLTFRKSNNNPRAKRMALEAKVELEEAWEILNKLEQIVEDEIDSALKADANLFRNWDFTEGWE